MKLPSLLLCACLLAATPAWAEVSRDAAAGIAQRQSGGGRVLSVERSDADGRAVWRVKVLTRSGDVRVILVDAASGRQL
ncbi:MAG: peptidase [Comamonadaceae bacterium]|nr:MAG: peptidase [Comamonadaceae bacterium]